MIPDDLISQQQFVTDTLNSSPWHMSSLRIVRELGLTDWAIGAGFVRNAVWDRLHRYGKHTPLADIDVLFFEHDNLDPALENQIESTLQKKLPNRPWSARNQARMHIRNQDQPYHSTVDAMSHWLETPTCVAARIDENDAISILAPFGLSDLVHMKGAPTPSGLKKFDQYLERMTTKNWPMTWPKVRVEGLTQKHVT